jgi:hypothetical protein
MHLFWGNLASGRISNNDGKNTTGARTDFDFVSTIIGLRVVCPYHSALVDYEGFVVEKKVWNRLI